MKNEITPHLVRRILGAVRGTCPRMEFKELSVKMLPLINNFGNNCRLVHSHYLHVVHNLHTYKTGHEH